MKQAVQDAFEKTFYHILPGQWLRKTLPGVIFANNNIQEKIFDFA